MTYFLYPDDGCYSDDQMVMICKVLMQFLVSNICKLLLVDCSYWDFERGLLDQYPILLRDWDIYTSFMKEQRQARFVMRVEWFCIERKIKRY